MVRPLTAKAEIRAILNRDREWAIYALADLDDSLFAECEWWGCGHGLALIFRGLAIRPIFIMGDAAEARRLFAALPPGAGYLNIQQHLQEAATAFFAYRHRNEMCRMILGEFTPRAGEVVRLTLDDFDSVEALFASGHGSGIAFSASQLGAGYFRGVRENGDLIAVAGAHVVSRNEGVAGVGNVFVRADRRGFGLAQRVLSAVVAAVREEGVRTIGLNVEHTNRAAIRAYENLGFQTAFRYFEGFADRLA
jgi:ribosomal protein S18 acetylase RimI-like enzyme